MDAPPIFVGGAGRSGTTLIRVILDSHPRIACGPELKITYPLVVLHDQFQTSLSAQRDAYGHTEDDLHRMFADMLVRLLDRYRRMQGKPRVAEKTPNNVLVFPSLARMFPRSPFVQTVRDGRDVVASLLTMDWRDEAGRPVAFCRDPVEGARYWVSAIRAGRLLLVPGSGAEDRYFEVRYESIVQDPEGALRPLFEFLGEPWDPAVLRFHETRRALADESSAEQVVVPLYESSVGRWRRDLSPEQQAAIKPVLGETLVELGYAADHEW
jgi:hypothetical protein